MASAAITTANQHQNQTVKQRLLPKATVFYGKLLSDAQNGANYLAIRGAQIDRVHRANKPRVTLARYHHRQAGEAPKWPSPAAKQTNDPKTA